ncbi:hypothetical protein DES53_105119 [Roseimicrobium gellanilyticum]|uniref:Uncharacterized protein n=1 Tax=Roseimicrobium gellanilyticum TaxID=748857 RepID=A0A366HLA7_9BACT|nr:hypothetical protein [Roseimicrobium gellanilyticum]RBP43720.1 hypothetical protein DES53_105119 [Roseimicrobium gellanilyticum]
MMQNCTVIILLAACLSAATPVCGKAEAQPIMEVRQRIIRAPESAIIEAVMTHGQGAAFAAEVQRMVTAGEAHEVSSLAGATQGDSRLQMETGKTIQWPWVCDENEDNFTSTPTDFFSVLLGSSLEVAARKSYAIRNEPGTEVAWAMHFSPRDPTTLEWPLVWPAKKEPGAGIFKQQDLYEERLTVIGWAPASGSSVLGFMRPADHVEMGSRREAVLDVILAEAHPQSAPASSNQPATESLANVMLLGLGVSSEDAQTLLESRDILSDHSLLKDLLQRQRAGKATLRVVAGLQATSPVYDSDLESIRRHSRPADTIVFPTSWECDTGVGTQLRIQRKAIRTLVLDLMQSPCPPRQQTWQCAKNSPEMTIWRPQFYEQSVRTTTTVPADGVSLIAIIRTPECLKDGEGLAPGETMLLFARLDETPAGTKDIAPEAAAQLEGEAMVFEVLAKEFDSWNTMGSPTEDQSRLEKLLFRVKEGTATLAGHAVVKTLPGKAATVRMVYLMEYCAEGDPVEEIPGRFWPGAMGMIPVGTAWAITAEIPSPTGPFDFSAPPSVTLTYKLSHDAAFPRLPTLDETLKHFPKVAGTVEAGSPPDPVEFKATWEGKKQVKSGQAICLGVRKIPGGDDSKVHVAFVRLTLKPVR